MKPVEIAGLRLPMQPESGRATPFELVCVCGKMLHGERQSRQQIVRCSACGAERFVLPSSPLPGVQGTVAGSTTSARAQFRFWAGPLLAGAIALVLAVIGVLLLIRQTGPNRAGSTAKEPSDEERLEAHLAAGRSAFADGSFQRASAELSEALSLVDRLPGKSKTAERRQIVQQQRQAALLADLLSVSIADIVRQSIGMPADEWQEAFQQRYANRSVVLDATFHREQGGQILSNHRIRVNDVDANIDFRKLKLLEQLFEIVPAGQPQRMLLGMRLSSIRRDSANWVIVPESASGVLITDHDIIAGLSLPNAADYEELIRRQQGWLDLLP